MTYFWTQKSAHSGGVSLTEDKAIRGSSPYHGLQQSLRRWGCQTSTWRQHQEVSHWPLANVQGPVRVHPDWADWPVVMQHPHKRRGGHFIFWHSYGETIWAHPWDEISLHSTLNHPVHLLTTILPLINMNDNSHFIASMDQVTICCRIHPSCNYKEKSSTSHRIAWWMFSRRTSCVLLQLLMVNIRAEPLAHVRHSLQWPLGWSFMSPSAFLDSSQPQSNKNGHSSASRGRKILFNVLVTLSH